MGALTLRDESFPVIRKLFLFNVCFFVFRTKGSNISVIASRPMINKMFVSISHEVQVTCFCTDFDIIEDLLKFNVLHICDVSL